MNHSPLFDTGLEKNPANFSALTPLKFLQRAARTYPDHVSILHGPLSYTWNDTYQRCRKLASALQNIGINVGETVAIMATNTPEIFEAHFGVPMSGAVLNALNTRLDAETIAYCLEHGEAKVLITDTEFSDVIRKVLSLLQKNIIVIDIHDPQGNGGDLLGYVDYETFLKSGSEEAEWVRPNDEWDAISLNYTSGTTGSPKGVVYHHRGAYLNALSNAVGWDMGHHPVYLWTLPMFHCNGWCFPWTLAALGGTSVCLRKVDAGAIFSAISEQKVSHFCGAPIILNFIINADSSERKSFDHTVNVMTAAAPPPASVLARMEQEGFNMTHVYGLTETYGPAVICAWHDEWNELSTDERASKKSRQGVPYHVLDDLDIIDPDTMQSVPSNASTMGEAMFRGNLVMKGYLKNPEATANAFAGGWFHSGDLGVMCEDNYIQLKDRSKDIIISGGENISSIEVEDALYRHESIVEAAVVARPDNKWGETPCAFVNLKSGHSVTAEEIIAFCRQNLAHYKCPQSVVFGDLPKTSTGKIQKFKLRAKTEELGSLN